MYKIHYYKIEGTKLFSLHRECVEWRICRNQNVSITDGERRRSETEQIKMLAELEFKFKNSLNIHNALIADFIKILCTFVFIKCITVVSILI